MSREDLVWLAGLCEGEACFDMQKRKYPRIRIGMTDRDVVGRAATLMGTGVRLSLKARPHAPMWHAELQGERAAALMEDLLPLMGARRSGDIASILGTYRLARSGERVMPGPSISRPPGLPMAV